MAKLKHLVAWCDERVKRKEIADFPGSMNGLQVANNGEVTRIGAAVDAGMEPFKRARAAGVDFLIVHHGLFWSPPRPVTRSNYDKLKLLLDSNIAVYGAHLPLDCHPEIGNNALLIKKLGMEPGGTFLPYEGNDIAFLADCNDTRDALRAKLDTLFPGGVTAMEFGSKKPGRIAVLTGSGQSAVGELRKAGVDTLITGELKQQHFNQAQEEGLNLYCCGHYATETFGVCALAEEAAAQFGIDWEFFPTECPL